MSNNKLELKVCLDTDTNIISIEPIDEGVILRLINDTDSNTDYISIHKGVECFRKEFKFPNILHKITDTKRGINIHSNGRKHNNRVIGSIIQQFLRSYKFIDELNKAHTIYNENNTK